MKKNILLVEDDKDLAGAIKTILTEEEYNVVLAYDGAEGLYKLSNQKFHLIISDIKMPKIDGVQFIENIRKSTKDDSTIPIIVLSAFLNEDIIRKLAAYSQIQYLVKPVTRDSLLDKINTLL